MGTLLNVAQEDTDSFFVQVWETSWHERIIMPFYGPRFGFDRRLQVSKTCRVRTNSLIMIQQFKWKH
jgi:hypothetical protein